MEPVITSDEHIRTAEYFLLESDREFDAGERLQASEKLWGAAAHSVIAVAQKLDWPAAKHGNLKNGVRRLARRSRDDNLTRGFAAGERFHANFYHDFMPESEIEIYRPMTRTFVAEMLVLAGSIE